MRPAKLGGLLAILVILGTQASACRNSSVSVPASAGREERIPQAREVAVAQVVVGAVPAATITYSGEVKAKRQVTVAAKTMGRIEELHVDVGATVKTGEVIGRLESTGLQAQLKQAEAAVDLARAKLAQLEAGARPETIAQARATLDSARERYTAMQEGGRVEAVAQAEAALRSAEARLAQLKAGPTPEQLAQAEAAVRAARNQLWSVQAQADSAMSKMGSGYTADMKEAQSGAAYEQIAIAESRLAELRAGATQEQIVQAQAAVDQARAAWEIAGKPFTDRDLKQAENAVIAAEQQLRLAENPFTEVDLEAARAPVAQAQANVELVKAQLADASIVAPMDGTVAERHLSPGALALPGVPIVTIISPDLEVSIAVAESQSGLVHAGQAARITVGAYPDKGFGGTVSSVAPTVDPRARTVVAKVSVSDPEGQLKAGMFASVVLTAGEEKAGLLVPTAAVARRGERDIAFVVLDGRASMREVRLGVRAGDGAQVLDGLAIGETVVLDARVDLRDGDRVAVTSVQQ